MRSLALLVALLTVGGSAPPPRELKVTKPRASVMEKPQFWGRSIAEVVHDQKVSVVDASRFPWLKVRLRDNKQGFVHSSAFDAGSVRFSGAADAADSPAVTERSLTLAARGLSKEVEDGYRKGKPDLAGAYKRIDRYEEAAATAPSDEELRRFTAEGGLLGGAGLEKVGAP